ncbi:MAG: hypothetical protein ACRDL2_18230 [Gaiellaceae bacterium]
MLALGYALATGGVPGVGAIFTAETGNPNAAAQGGWIPAPSNPASSLDGSPYSQVHLAWVSGHSTTMPSGSNPVTGQTIKYADGGSGGSASCGSYSSFTTVGPTAMTADLTGSDIADWWCFEVYSTSASSWTSPVATFTPQRLLLATSVVFTNGGKKNGQSDNGDTIVITANQPLPGAPGNIPVQVCGSGRIEIVSSACGTTGSLGEITGLSVTGGNVSYPTSATSVSGSTLTITLAGASNGTPGWDPVSGTGSFTAGSLAVSGSGQHACTASPACSVSTSGSF